MKPQFTTSCYVRVEDKNKRKEICDKLTKSGYIAINMAESIDSNYLFAFDGWISRLYGIGLRGEQGRKELEAAGFVECDSVALFLDFVGMRSDTLNNQICICLIDYSYHPNYEQSSDMGEQIDLCVGDIFNYENADYSDHLMQHQFRRATATEIVEWYKHKGEKE